MVFIHKKKSFCSWFYKTCKERFSPLYQENYSKGIEKNSQTYPQWYILIGRDKQGPYSVEQLKRHPKVTPDTLVWKEGYVRWVPIYLVKELKDIFSEKKPNKEEKKKETDKKGEVLVATNQFNPFPFLFWLLLFLTLAYLIYRYFL